MPIYILQGSLPVEPAQQPRTIDHRDRHAIERIEAQCPEVRWLARYPIVGPFDFVDVFQAPDLESARRAAGLVRRRRRGQAEERGSASRSRD